MFEQLIVIIIGIIATAAAYFGAKLYDRESFVDLVDIQHIDYTIKVVVNGIMNYRMVKLELAQHTHEEIMCGNKNSLPMMIVWDAADGFYKSCSYKKGSASANPDYILTYKLRDLLTTIYVRSFEDKTQRMIHNTRLYSIQLLRMFNDGLERLIKAYNVKNGTYIKPNQLCVLYKGGNVIATYTRLLYNKIQRYTQSNRINQVINIKKSELKRGDWDYSLHVDHSLSTSPIVDMARTTILSLLEYVKMIMDRQNNAGKSIFNYSLVAKTIQQEFFKGGDVRSFINEYAQITNVPVSIYQIDIPTKSITATHISEASVNNSAQPSKYSYTREKSPNITDSYQVSSVANSRVGASPTGVLIGFIEDLVLQKTYLTSDFDLARVKINNRVTMKIGDSVITRNLSADLIDMSFINPGDTKSLNIHGKIESIRSQEFYVRRVGSYVVPYLSTTYLFYDLCNMIIEEGVYPWADKKYAKRLGRLIDMGVLSVIIADSGQTELIKSINALIRILSQIDVQDLPKTYNLFQPVTWSNFEPVFSISTNFFTYALLKSVYKTIIFDRYINNYDSLDKNEVAYVKHILQFVFNGMSDTTEAEFRKGVDLAEFKLYIQTSMDRLSGYLDLLSSVGGKQIIISPNEPITNDLL